MTFRAQGGTPYFWGSGTWAQVSAVNPGTSGVLANVTDVGADGTTVRWNGSRWKPVGGVANLKSFGPAVSGITNATETIVLQTLIPAGLLQANDAIRVWLYPTKSGSTDAASGRFRMGTAGTIADTQILSGNWLGATGITGGFVWDAKIVSNTSVLRTGNNNSTSSPIAGSGTSAIVAAVSITDVSTNPMYFSVTLVSGGATDTVACQNGYIQWVA